MVSFLNAIREAIPVERVTTAKTSEGIVQKGPTLQQHRIIKVAHRHGWYEAPKRISIRGLASKLGLSKSTVAEQLVKAESEIVGGFLKKSR
jgi:predicted DNA binding protein